MDELARRLNVVLHDFDIYEYEDSEMNIEKILKMLKSDPYEVIRFLVGMAEELIY